MASYAYELLVAIDNGKKPRVDHFNDVPPFQWDIWFSDLAPHCPDRLRDGTPMSLQRNALRCDFAWNDAAPRCGVRSPDGRGLAWVLSGGSPLAYGKCDANQCWRTKSTEE